MPILLSLWAVFGPTPHNLATGSGARKYCSSPYGTVVIALGGSLPLADDLPTSLAILATSLFVATPIEHGDVVLD